MGEIEGFFATSPGVRVPPAEKIFVNRNLRLDRIDVVGFDMDYTLAVYAGQAIERLAYTQTIERMITDFGRPTWMRSLRYEPELALRGLVVDKKLGNLVKMDAHGHVARVLHGKRPLTKDERVEHYRKQKIRLSSARYVWIDTLFALPEAALYAQAVDGLEARGEAFDPATLYDEVRASIDAVHRDGSLKAVVMSDLPRYVERDPLLAPTLHRLRSGGKKLFVLTNSHWAYTDVVMTHLLDGALPEYQSWRSYFDAVVCGASKPAFFSERDPFLEVDPESGDLASVPATELSRSKVYQGGNLGEFEAYTGWGGDRVLYVGDHIYGDMLRTKRSGLWRTAMIVAELEREIGLLRDRRALWERLHRLEGLRDRLDDAIAEQKAVVALADRAKDAEGLRRAKDVLEPLRGAMHEILADFDRLSEELANEANPHWGFLFKDGNESSRFGAQVRDYACLYTSRVTNLRHYSPAQYFRAPWDTLPHEG